MLLLQKDGRSRVYLGWVSQEGEFEVAAPPGEYQVVVAPGEGQDLSGDDVYRTAHAGDYPPVKLVEGETPVELRRK